MAGTVKKQWAAKGIAGFYPGSTAVAFRQGTNWGSRVGFAEVARPHIAELFHGYRKAKLTLGQEVLAGALAGIFSCWNHPFDVARIEGQARAVVGESAISMTEVFRMVHAEYGVRGLFQGIIPRALFSVNQTLFMITGAKILRDYFG